MGISNSAVLQKKKARHEKGGLFISVLSEYVSLLLCLCYLPLAEAHDALLSLHGLYVIPAVRVLSGRSLHGVLRLRRVPHTVAQCMDAHTLLGSASCGPSGRY